MHLFPCLYLWNCHHALWQDPKGSPGLSPWEGEGLEKTVQLRTRQKKISTLRMGEKQNGQVSKWESRCVSFLILPEAEITSKWFSPGFLYCCAILYNLGQQRKGVNRELLSWKYKQVNILHKSSHCRIWHVDTFLGDEYTRIICLVYWWIFNTYRMLLRLQR